VKSGVKIAFEYLPVLLAFLLPFGGFLSVLIILWFITSWFCFNRETVNEGFKNKWFWILLSFLLLHVLSATFSDNKREALTSIEVKMSFLAFPYFLFLFRFSQVTIRNICVAFVSGCFFALLACLARATYIYVMRGDNYFFYNDFSYWIHTGYFSMYMLFALIIVQLAYPKWFKEDIYSKYIRRFFTVMFVVGIFLCASKIGFIALVVAGSILVLIKFRSFLNAKTIGVSVAGLCILIFLLYKFVPGPFERLAVAFDTTTAKNIDKSSGESTAVRILIWNECVDIIKTDFLLGVGSGDANDVLRARYEEKGLTGALEHNLNAHNQFFQTFIALGIIGFVMLLLITFGVMIYGFLRANVILGLFGIIIILNFLVESMLQTQAGNLFFVYFLCLLLRYDLLKNSELSPADCR
jgi:O-antigen ligase